MLLTVVRSLTPALPAFRMTGSWVAVVRLRPQNNSNSEQIQNYRARLKAMRGWVAFVLLAATCCFAQTAESYRRSATEFARQKSWDEAIGSYRKALELEPDDAATHYQLGVALKYKG